MVKSVEKITSQELEGLNKQQMLEQIRVLRAKIDNTPAVSEDDILHELQVYQIELEMQNRDLRDAQLQLEETRDRYADLYDFAPVSYITLDEKGCVENINLTGAEMLGQVRARIIKQPFMRWVSKDDLGVFYHHLLTTLQSGKKQVDEIKIHGGEGQLLDVRIESVRYRDQINDAFLCRSIALDVTEHNQIKDEMHHKEQQLALIINALPVLIAYIDANEQHLFANKTYIDWFMDSRKSIIGKPIREAWGKDNYSNIKAYLKDALSGHQASFDLELPFDGNEHRYINTTLIPDYDINHQVCGVIVLIGDITDRLALEASERQRLLDIAHFSRLSSMGEMASEIAHELNQPLTAIAINSDVCRRMVETGKGGREKIIQLLTGIGKQALRAGEIIRRIRGFAGKKELQTSMTATNKLVREALNFLVVETRAHKVRVSLDLAEDLPQVKVDNILIEQVIFNLARNAIEAMDEIEVPQRLLAIQTSLTEQKEIEVRIEDAGPGLSAEQVKQIFEPFYTSKTDGLGMGLIICQSIIEAHNGRIWAASNNHGGTAFSFTLPLG